MTAIGNIIFLYSNFNNTFLSVLLGGRSAEKEGSMGIPENDPGYDVAVIAVIDEILILSRLNVCILSDY